MTWTIGSAGALALVMVWTTSAVASETEEVPRTPPKKAIGEAGDVVLEDILGARSHSPTSNFGVVPGAGGIGAIGFVNHGPSFSAAWFSMATSSSGPSDGLSVRTSRWSFQPSADVFIARGLSVGGMVGYERNSVHLPSNTGSFDTSSFSIDPRIGYALPVTSQIAIWPRVRAGLTLHRVSLDRPNGEQYRAGVDVPLAIRVSSHVLLDVGPELTYSVLEGGNGMSIRTFTFAGCGGLSLVF